MPTMTKEREGYHTATLQLPLVLWQALCEEAERKEESATKTLTRILATHYRVKKEDLPATKRAGRPPKQK